LAFRWGRGNGDRTSGRIAGQQDLPPGGEKKNLATRGPTSAKINSGKDELSIGHYATGRGGFDRRAKKRAGMEKLMTGMHKVRKFITEEESASKKLTK